MIVNVNGQNVKLPDFFIVGAAKSGTTSLAKYLAEHPDIYIPPEKELHFFAFAGEKPIYYNEHILGPVLITDFDEYCKYFENVETNKILGEASVTYLYKSLVDKVLMNISSIYKEKKSDLKILIILRNPVDRAFSQYTTRLFQRENLPFLEACNKWSERNKNNWSIAYDYIGFSLYYEAVKKYMENFKFVKVFLYEDLKDKPLETIQEAYEFLGIDAEYIPLNIGKKYNVSKVPKNKLYWNAYSFFVSKNPLKPIAKKVLPNKLIDIIKEKVDTKLFYKPKLDKISKRNLQDFFREDILKLQELIGRDLNHWLKED